MANPDWQRFKSVINGLAFEYFNQEIVVWHRLIQNIDPHGEGLSATHEPIDLKCYIGYNDFRVWPMDRPSESGVVDMQNMYLILNIEYLRENGWLNSSDYFAFNNEADYFEHQGILYDVDGDTQVAQAGDEPVLFFLILKRKEYATGTKVHG